MVKETSKKVFKQKNSKFEKKNFLTFLSPKGVAQGYPLARPPKRNLKIASVRPPKMSKDTSMQNFKPLGLVDVSGDILGSTFWLRSFNYEDSCTAEAIHEFRFLTKILIYTVPGSDLVIHVLTKALNDRQNVSLQRKRVKLRGDFPQQTR